jgi:hypothetical protein
VVARSTIGVRAIMTARLTLVTYDRGLIIRLNNAKTRHIAARGYLTTESMDEILSRLLNHRHEL